VKNHGKDLKLIMKGRHPQALCPDSCIIATAFEAKDRSTTDDKVIMLLMNDMNTVSKG
jgi:hypothetical protein